MPSPSPGSKAYSAYSYKRGTCVGFWRDRAVNVCLASVNQCQVLVLRLHRAAELTTWGVGPDVYEKKKERKKTKMAFLAYFFLASRVLAGTFEGTTVMVYAA